jgi:hypothetical protein
MQNLEKQMNYHSTSPLKAYKQFGRYRIPIQTEWERVGREKANIEQLFLQLPPAVQYGIVTISINLPDGFELLQPDMTDGGHLDLGTESAFEGKSRENRTA